MKLTTNTSNVTLELINKVQIPQRKSWCMKLTSKSFIQNKWHVRRKIEQFGWKTPSKTSFKIVA
jgi:hypothetical protein